MEAISTFSNISTANNRSIPFDFQATERLPNWRSSLATSLSPNALAVQFDDALVRYQRFAGECQPAERNVLVASSGVIMTSMLPTLEAALAISAESRTGLVIESEEPEVAYLKAVSSVLPRSRGLTFMHKIPSPRLPLRRSAQVTSWWTPFWRIPGALLRPEIMAIAENSLLISSARESVRRIGFQHMGTIFNQVRRQHSDSRHGIDVPQLASSLIRRMVDLPGLSEPIRLRLQDVLVALVIPVFEQAAWDLAEISRQSRLPMTVWSGTGGPYASRVIALEVLRRGGMVTRFDHGGTLPMADAPTTVNFVELSVSSHFVTATEKLGRFLESTQPNSLTAHWHTAEISGASGDESMSRLPLNAPQRSLARRKVMYVPMFLRGYSKHALYPLSDPVYLDWQIRLAVRLGEMPVRLLCKPHPEGVFSGRPHPLAQVAPCSIAPFETEMGDADLFLFDRCSSTTFWRAVCTDRPVILIRIGPPEFNVRSKEVLERRCTIIDAQYDDDNLPQVDLERLSDAILGGPDRVDASEMRGLFMGRYAAEVS